MSAGMGIQPFDLQAPARLLVPNPHDRKARTRTVELGGTDTATLELIQWDRCRPSCRALGSHEAGHRMVLRVPCENLPHCGACECGDGHSIYLTAEQEATMKAMLP